MNSKGSNTLLQASADCKFRLLRTVVEGGTSVDIWDNNRQTPLMLACSSAVETEDKEKVIHYLLKKHAKVNLQDLQGRTASMLACISTSSPPVIQALIDAKANPWLEDKAGCTSFDHAINAGNLETIRLLVHSCREHKLLLKADNAVEMKHLEDCFSKIQEMRKVSWPLMGPSFRNTPGQLYCSSGAPASADDGKLSAEPKVPSPRLERRRKRSICLFDPLDIDEIMKNDQDIATGCQPVSPSRVENTTRSTKEEAEASSDPSERKRPPSLSQMTEEERISLHFSSTESSVEEPGSGLMTLFNMKDSNDTPCYINVPQIVTNEEQCEDSATAEKKPCANKIISLSQGSQHQKSLTDDVSFSQEPKGSPYNATTSCKASQKLSSALGGKVSPFQETSSGDADYDTQKGAMLAHEESAANESKAETTKQDGRDLESHATKEQAETNSKRCHAPTPPANKEPLRGRTESLSSLSTTGKAKVSPKPARRKTLPDNINPPTNVPRNGLTTPGERQTTELGEPRRYTISSAEVNKLCGSFGSQRLSPTPRELFFIDAENKKSPTPRDMGLAEEAFHSLDEPTTTSTRFGARSPFNDSNTNQEIIMKTEHIPTLVKESTGKGVQLPAISLRRRSPLLQINTRGLVATGREEITERISPRNEELLHIDEKCASPTSRGRTISPFSGRKSPLVAKYETSSASAADTRGKPPHKSAHYDAFPGLRQHASSGKVEQDGPKHGILKTPQLSLEEHDQQKLAPLSPSKEISKKPPSLLPPLRINNNLFSSLDSEEGYYSCSPSPFDIESPKRTPGHSEQPRYLFRPISPRSAQRFNPH